MNCKIENFKMVSGRLDVPRYRVNCGNAIYIYYDDPSSHLYRVEAPLFRQLATVAHQVSIMTPKGKTEVTFSQDTFYSLIDFIIAKAPPTFWTRIDNELPLLGFKSPPEEYMDRAVPIIVYLHNCLRRGRYGVIAAIMRDFYKEIPK